MNTYTVGDKLRLFNLRLEVDLKRRDGHICYEWKIPETIHFTRRDLFIIHRGFFHPKYDKFLNF